MKCGLCGVPAKHAHAISEHWKSAHPAEYKKKQKAKLEARTATEPAEPEEEPVDAEQQLIANAVFNFEEAVDAGVDTAGCRRVVQYLASRFVGAAAG